MMTMRNTMPYPAAVAAVTRSTLDTCENAAWVQKLIRHSDIGVVIGKSATSNPPGGVCVADVVVGPSYRAGRCSGLASRRLRGRLLRWRPFWSCGGTTGRWNLRVLWL
jgi:hypothetical protein